MYFWKVIFIILVENLFLFILYNGYVYIYYCYSFDWFILGNSYNDNFWECLNRESYVDRGCIDICLYL